ncbi:MAG: hypothetical protein A2W03_09795 [Candidatus Aminicenantes bacterium RBG_16_63_16]|nr:MAG: hypothetical protein A2W03_09795 [Candidatus Aminicenantes bacterium RBG_16_63_16]
MPKDITILGQVLQTYSRYEFGKAVKEAKTERNARGFSSWSHFVSMLFGQLAGQDSLCGIEAGLASQSRALYHFGVKRVRRSTLAYANIHRTHDLFKKIFERMLSKCLPLAPQHKFRFKNPFYSLDATIINLCLSLFDWAKFRTTKGAVKLHVKLNQTGYLPTFVQMTTGREREQRVAPVIPLEKGDVAVFDKAFTNFAWYASLLERGIYFVTRLKRNADYRVAERRDISHLKNIFSDQLIEFKGFSTPHKCPYRLRRIRSKDSKTGSLIVLLTNQFDWSAQTIALIYKDRWQIELFFKALRQQLKLKSFVGTSRNSLLSQLWVALIAYLLLSYLKFGSRFAWSLYMLSSILPTNLFSRRNLWDWLNAPFYPRSQSPPQEPQLRLSFG